MIVDANYELKNGEDVMPRRKIRLSPKLQTRKSPVTAPRSVLQLGRNEPCPCGSGKKYKVCHLSKGESFLKKMAKKQEKEKLKKARKRRQNESA